MDTRAQKLRSCLAAFCEMPEAGILIHYRSRDSRLSFDERLSITHCIDKAFSPVFLEMKAESAALSESDLIYCALHVAGFSPEVIADCLSISKDSLRMRKIRVREKLSASWCSIFFPEQETASATKGATKSATGKCDDYVAQHISGPDQPSILLQQNQSKSKVMETKNVSFGGAIRLGFKNMFKFSGRASRSEFWYFILFYAIVLNVLAFLVPFVIRLLPHLGV